MKQPSQPRRIPARSTIGIGKSTFTDTSGGKGASDKDARTAAYRKLGTRNIRAIMRTPKR